MLPKSQADKDTKYNWQQLTKYNVLSGGWYTAANDSHDADVFSQFRGGRNIDFLCKLIREIPRLFMAIISHMIDAQLHHMTLTSLAFERRASQHLST